MMPQRKPKPRAVSSGASGYDYALAEDVIAWIERYIVVPDGALVGQPFVLTAEQKLFIRETFRTRNGRRVVRRAILSVARKWGKTTLQAALVLAFLCGPLARAGQNLQLISAANARDQAAIVFLAAKRMVQRSKILSEYIVIRETAKELFCPESGSLYKAISADSSTAHGLNPAVFIFDELGQAGRKSELREALSTAQGAQAEPLEIIISTQAPTDDALLSVLIDDGLAANDERIYVQLHMAPDDMDPYSEEAWRSANPHIGVNVSLDYYREQAERARRLPAESSAFENLLLNRRVSPFVPFLSPQLWRQASARSPDPEFLRGLSCWGGLDLSSRTDLTALALLFPVDDDFHWLMRFFSPAMGVEEREQRDRVPYRAWASSGLLTLTPGPTVDLGVVAESLAEVQETYDLQSVGYDRWRVDALQQVMKAKGIALPLEPVGQGYANMTPAIEEFTSWALEDRLVFGPHPILQFCIASCVLSTDPAGNKKPDKARSTGRIDGVAAALCAVHAYTTAERKPPPVTMGDLGKFLIMV